YPCAPGCRGTDFSNVAHCVASSIAMIALFPCPCLLWLSTRRDRRWRLLGCYSLSIQAVAIVGAILVIRGLLAPQHFLLCGLVERSFLGIYYLWVVGIGLKLQHLGRARRSAGMLLAELAPVI